jgi:SAM-dependent methyltransferase
MSDQHDVTIETYQEHFDAYVANTPKVVGSDFQIWMDSFARLLPPHARIIELGSAFGRDARYFRDKGFEVLCTDVVPQALEELARDGFETEYYDFRTQPKGDWASTFDGYFANAVLLHADQKVFENAIESALQMLKSGGVGAISLKNGEGSEVSNEKVGAPRFFLYHSKEEVTKVLTRAHAEVLEMHEADGEKWLHIIFKKP